MIFIDDDSHGLFLGKTEFLTGLVPELMTVCLYLGGFDAVHHNTATRFQVFEHFGHDLLQMPPVTSDEDGVRGSDVVATS